MNIFQLSPFVENQFNRNRELNDLVDKNLNLEKDWLQFQKSFPHLDNFARLRKYRRSRLALIAAQDCEENAIEGHLKTLKQTSNLAQLMLKSAYDYACDEIKQRFGIVRDAEGQCHEFIIFALGKLGGSELNYSSDVDLVFCYTGIGQSDGNKCIDAESYFTRLGRRIIQLLDSQTNDGIVYRVDMRLRPFGSAAPLVCSTHFLIDYFETEGRDWERYAWLRARFIAGNKVAALKTLKQCEPFIYRKYLDYSVFDSLRQIKEQIERKQLNDEDNLKLGIGGIREIEFIVQTLQLTFAGRNKQLRGNDLWQQLHNLTEFKHLSVKELKRLTAAWLFLRRLENLCQIIDDRDSHHLPPSLEKLHYLALCMHFTSHERLLEQLTNYRNNVHEIFDKLFLSNQSTQQNSLKNAQIQQIKDAVSAKNYPKSIKHKIYATWDALVPILAKVEDSDDIIVRFQHVINAVVKRPSYLSMLIESPLILEKLVVQLSHGNYFSDVIAKAPSLLEILFEGIDENDFDMGQQWQYFSAKHLVNDVEDYLELLCQFKQRMQFKIIMAQVDEILNQTQTGLYLTNLAEMILAHVIKQAWQETTTKILTSIEVTDLIVIAYGSMAVKTMHMHSDFDLVFILNHDLSDGNHKFVIRWIKKIIHFLSVQTYHGNLYELDTQLRPNGKSGSAIVSKNSFKQYQLHEAWIWEHAALIKTRTVYATKEQKQWFEELRKRVLTVKRDKRDVRQQLRDMAHKLATQSSKNHQQEFQKLGDILIQAHDNPDLIKIIV